LDVPFPANYGAAIDMYFRIKNLSAQGVRIILHCFEYGRGKASRLSNYCEQVYYYPRKSIWQFPFRTDPYIVYSRKNSELAERIFADDYPVLLEGVHTCSLLMDERYKQKPFYVRMHNVEHEYYEYLAKATTHAFKKYYYQKESERLKKFEKNLDRARCLFSVSERDHATLSAQFPRVEYVPPFIYNDTIDCKPGRGSYALYHGNLTVAENIQAAEFLIQEIFPGLKISLLIAGTGASALSKTTKAHNIEFISSPSTPDLKELICNAHMNVLPTFQPTGIKHKLINSLFVGRHCVVNPLMVEGNGLAQFCHVAKDASGMRKIILDLYKQDFPQSEIDRRKMTLQNIYSNTRNAEKMIEVIFGTAPNA
jgi:hypothetical protein